MRSQSNSDQLWLFDNDPDVAANPVPMYYLGSKARISDWILDHVSAWVPGRQTFVDLFAGTGSVTLEARRKGYHVVANDVQRYSSTVLSALLAPNRDGIGDFLVRLAEAQSDESLLSDGREYAADLLQQERHLLSTRDYPDWDWNRYREFCEGTPIVEGTVEDSASLRSECGWNLFIKYYGNTYFGIEQCLEIDLIRQMADELDEILMLQVLGATISAMSRLASSTTHLAQYLKPRTDATARALAKTRSQRILDETALCLKRLQKTFVSPPPSRVMSMDYLDALASLRTEPELVVYADPPYFKEHYSRYYHVLDTFCLYDFPVLTLNPQTHAVTIGRYRSERFSSEFGKRAQAAEAFSRLFGACSRSQLPVALSYAETSIVPMETVMALASEAGFQVRAEVCQLGHSGQGQPRHRTVTEHLLLLRPRTDTS